MGRVVEMEKDPKGMGWWVAMLLTRTDGMHIRIVTAYRVCQDTIGEEQENAAYKQQQCIMKSNNVTNPNPKKQWYVDLEKKVQEWKKKSPVLVLCNANSDLLGQDLGSVLSNAQLYDLSVTHHGIDSPATYIIGRKPLTTSLVPLTLSNLFCGSHGFPSTTLPWPIIREK
eukprot:10730616-Ditylum_brightwellii.AAC.2